MIFKGNKCDYWFSLVVCKAPSHRVDILNETFYDDTGYSILNHVNLIGSKFGFFPLYNEFKKRWQIEW